LKAEFGYDSRKGFTPCDRGPSRWEILWARPAGRKSGMVIDLHSDTLLQLNGSLCNFISFPFIGLTTTRLNYDEA